MIVIRSYSVVIFHILRWNACGSWLKRGKSTEAVDVAVRGTFLSVNLEVYQVLDLIYWNQILC